MKQLTDILNERFVQLHNRSCSFIKKIPLEKLYLQSSESKDFFPISSCGEYILRSAGLVEQTFNGLTAKLWDDPFEWTLPEALFDNEKIIEYLSEVETIRNRGFSLLTTDADLSKEIPAPARLKTIFELLLETLAQAENYQGRAFAAFRFFSDEKLPR